MKKSFFSLQDLTKRSLVSALCFLLPFSTGSTPYAQQQSAPVGQAAPLPKAQLEGLVTPIALYPDELVGQILVASTYPLEIVQLAQWMKGNRNLKDKALVDAVKKQNWDPSIQALVSFPDLVKKLSENIQWTTDLGNAFLAQQSDVMSAIQSLRMQAKDSGKLQSNQQQTVETEVAGNKTVVVIEPADPEVIYVPSYDPETIWGAAAYPYPPMYYPPGGYVAAGLISFGVGAAIGAAWGGGGWGWGCGWGDNDININNNFVRNNNLSGSRTNVAGSGRWQHNPQHRGGTPYPNRQTADRFGGSTSRRAQGTLGAGAGGAAGRNLGQTGVGRGQGNLGGQRPSSLARSEFGGGSADRIGNRQVSSPSFDRGGAFGGVGSSGGFERASSSRGRSSMGGGGGRSSGGGGMRGGGGGGGRGGGGGGGRRR